MADRPVPEPIPWTPTQATERIRERARDEMFSLTLSAHAEDQMELRDLTTLDVLYVLKNGFVYANAEKSTRWGFFKYAMVCPTPNSNRREVKVIVIPSEQSCSAKIVTVMWADEPTVKG